MGEKSMNVAGLVSIMHDAIIEANEVSQMQYIRSLEKFFDSEGRPLVKEVVLPKSGDTQEMRTISVPLFCLIPFSSLKLKEIQMEFEAHIVGIEGREAAVNDLIIKKLAGAKKKAEEDKQHWQLEELDGKENSKEAKETKEAQEASKALFTKINDIQTDEPIEINELNQNILVSFETSTETSRLPKVKFNLSFTQGDVPEAVMKINDTYVAKFISFS